VCSSDLQAEFILPFQMASPQFLSRWNADPAIRLAHAKLYAQALAGAAVHLAAIYWALALLADDDEDKPTIDFDTTSTDFLKIKQGDTRIDVMGGLSQYLVFVSRLWHGTKKSTTGEDVPLRGKGANKFKGDMWDEMTKQLRYKLGPTASGLVDFFTQKTAVGQELPENKLARAGSIVARRLVPMTWPDIFEAERSLGWKQGTVAALEAFMGASVNTYGDYTKYRDGTPEERAKQFKSDLEKMQWNSTAPPYSDLLNADQMKKVEYRQQEVKGNAITAGLASEPDRKQHKSDETYQESVEQREKAIARLREMTAAMPPEKLEEVLKEYLKAEGRRSSTAKYKARLEKFLDSK
jgi:hypothetical protein